MVEESLEINRFRRIVPQVLATTAKNLILLDCGLTLAFPGLVIGTLLKPNDDIQLDNVSASWFGSVIFIFQPIGCLISGTILEYFGRQKSMLLVNIPHLLGWYIYYFSTSIAELFFAGILMGLGAGFMEAPVITYVGEISEPNLRGILISYSIVFTLIGVILEYFLGTMYHWRTAALISSFLPIITFVAISLVPETPMWLLSKGRVAEAEKSLCWLRGWVSPAHVQKELNELIRHKNATHTTQTIAITRVDSKGQENVNLVINGAGIQHDDPKSNKITLKKKLANLRRPEMRKPFILSVSCFVILYGCGYAGMRPYLMKVLEELRVPINPKWGMVLMACNSFTGVVICAMAIRYVGKRTLMLVSLTAYACCMLSLSIWRVFYAEGATDEFSSWVTLALYSSLPFASSLGMEPIPWMIMSEIFPYVGRGFATAVVAALAYIFAFLTSNTFLVLKTNLGYTTLFSIYGTIAALGIIYMYFELPETEGKSLEQIENSFKKKLNQTP